MRTSIKKKLIAFAVLALAQWAVLAHALTLPRDYHPPVATTRPVFTALVNNPWVYYQPYYYYGTPTYIYSNISTNSVSFSASVTTSTFAPFLYIQTGYNY